MILCEIFGQNIDFLDTIGIWLHHQSTWHSVCSLTMWKQRSASFQRELPSHKSTGCDLFGRRRSYPECCPPPAPHCRTINFSSFLRYCVFNVQKARSFGIMGADFVTWHLSSLEETLHFLTTKRRQDCFFHNHKSETLPWQNILILLFWLIWSNIIRRYYAFVRNRCISYRGRKTPDKMIFPKHNENDSLCFLKIVFKFCGRVDRRSAWLFSLNSQLQRKPR